MDGANDYLQVTHNASLLTPTAVTVSVWLYINDAAPAGTYTRYPFVIGRDSTDAPIGGCGATRDWSMHYYNDSNAWHLQWSPVLASGTGLSLIATQNIPSGQWVMATGTYDGVEAKFYINGSLSTSQTSPGTLASTTNPIRVGVRGAGGCGNGYHNGKLDEVMVWSRALSAQEIAWLYSNSQ
jgi:hypothetical protein